MANPTIATGFEPYGVLRRANQYEAGSACYPGDLVALASDGQVDPATSASTVVLGVCLTYASGAGVKIQVADDPSQQFIVAANSVSSVDTQTDIGNLANILAGTPSSSYKLSRQTLDPSSLVTTISAQLKLLGIEPRTNNDFGANVKCIVSINAHQLGNNRSAGE